MVCNLHMQTQWLSMKQASIQRTVIFANNRNMPAKTTVSMKRELLFYFFSMSLKYL